MKSRYKNKPQQSLSTEFVLGMLYVVELRLVSRISKERIKHKILMVGSEKEDIEKKLRWAFDVSEYSEFSVASVEKVREKIHILSTSIKQEQSPASAIVSTEEGSKNVHYLPVNTERDEMKLYAIGIATTMQAKDQDHALRRVCNAIVNSTLDHSVTGAKLSDNSTITIEEISKSSGYAKPRDVSSEVNRAHFVRG